MHTVRSCGRLSRGGGSARGGVSALGGVCSWGCLLPEGSALGGVCSWGGSAPGGCLLWGGVCSGGCLLLGGCVCSQGGLLWGGVCSWGVCSGGDVCSGGCLLLGGVCLLLGGGIPACTEADTPPRGQTDACKNITFATSLRTVIKYYNCWRAFVQFMCPARNQQECPWVLMTKIRKYYWLHLDYHFGTKLLSMEDLIQHYKYTGRMWRRDFVRLL